MHDVDRLDRSTRQRTIHLDVEADHYLEQMVTQRTGHGRFLSQLLLQDKLRRELAPPRPMPQREWESSGCHVEP